jgi:hypothetical protein
VFGRGGRGEGKKRREAVFNNGCMAFKEFDN